MNRGIYSDLLNDQDLGPRAATSWGEPDSGHMNRSAICSVCTESFSGCNVALIITML